MFGNDKIDTIKAIRVLEKHLKNDDFHSSKMHLINTNLLLDLFDYLPNMCIKKTTIFDKDFITFNEFNFYYNKKSIYYICLNDFLKNVAYSNILYKKYYSDENEKKYLKMFNKPINYLE